MKFGQIVVGNSMVTVTVKTDHKPLVNVFRKPLLSAPRRLQHMLLNLQRFNLRNEYVTGKDNVVADAISRAPLAKCPEEDFRHTTSVPNRQQANGKAEAAVKIAKQLLKKCSDSGTDFWYALLHWRNVPNRTGSSPAQRLFSRQTRTGLPTSLKNLMPRVVEDVPESIEVNRKKSKQQYDKKAKVLPDLEVGAPVYAQLNPDSCKQWTPAAVSQRQSDRPFVVDVDGSSYRRDRKHLTPARSRLTPDVSELSDPKPSATTNGQTPSRISYAEYTRNEVNREPSSVEPPTSSAPLAPVSESTSLASSSQTDTPRHPRREVKAPAKFKDYLSDFD